MRDALERVVDNDGHMIAGADVLPAQHHISPDFRSDGQAAGFAGWADAGLLKRGPPSQLLDGHLDRQSVVDAQRGGAFLCLIRLTISIKAGINRTAIRIARMARLGRDGLADLRPRGVAGIEHAELIELGKTITDADVHINPDYAYPAYGIPSEATNDAIRLAAQTEAMITDPVYEGKSMQGMIDLVKKGFFPDGSRVLYAHLGGAPALNGYAYVYRNG